MPLGNALAGVVFREWIQTATQDGVRPTQIVCADCPSIVKVTRKGKIPTRCKVCATRKEKEYQSSYQGKYQATYRAKNPTYQADYYANNIASDTDRKSRYRDAEKNRLAANPKIATARKAKKAKKAVDTEKPMRTRGALRK